MFVTRSVVVSFGTAAVLMVGACTRGDSPPAPPATSLATMNDRLKEYADLHLKLGRSLPNLSKEATAEQIDKNQRACETLVREARTKAKPGDIFMPEARPVIRRLLATIVAGPTASS